MIRLRLRHAPTGVAYYDWPKYVTAMKYWEIIADRLHAQGWSYGIAEHLTKHGLLFCVDAHRDGKRFIVKADDLLTAFLSLERDAMAPRESTGTRRAYRLKASVQ
jgi:hypothetical protein